MSSQYIEFEHLNESVMSIFTKNPCHLSGISGGWPVNSFHITFWVLVYVVCIYGFIAAAWVRSRVWQVGFVVDKVASGQVFSKYFSFPCQKPFIPPTSPSSPSQSSGADTQRFCDEQITRPRSPADCPRSSNWNITESFMEAAKAQNWAVEPQENNIWVYRSFNF
jgi:hypothetical protein